MVALDLQNHEMAIETSAKGSRRIALTPDRPVGAVTREALDTIRQLIGRVDIDVRPQEVPWSVPLDEDEIHAHYDPEQVDLLFGGSLPGRARAGRVPGSVSGSFDTGQCMVGIVRSRCQPLFRAPGRSPFERLHHAQCDGCPGDSRRLVARRSPIRQGRVLCLRPSGARRVRGRDALPRPGPLGRRSGRVHPELGRHPRHGPTHGRPPWSSPVPPSATRAWSATGTPPSRPVSTEDRRPSSRPCCSRRRRFEGSIWPFCDRLLR